MHTSLHAALGGMLIAMVILTIPGADAAELPPACYTKKATWWETLRASRPELVNTARSLDAKAKRSLWDAFWRQIAADFPESRAEGLSASLEKATAIPSPTGATELFVAPGGSDRNPGTREKPLASLEGARDAVRALKKRGPLTRPVRVVVRGGTYTLPRTLELGPEDSGTASCPILYQAAPGEKVVLSAGKRIVGNWKTDNGKIYYTDIPEARDAVNFGGGEPIRVRFDDKTQVDVTGKWITAAGYLHDLNEEKGTKRVRFSPRIPESGRYKVVTRFTPFGNRASNAPVVIAHRDGAATVPVNLRDNSGQRLLGVFPFEAGKQASITFETGGTDGYVSAQEVELVRVGDADAADPWKFRQLFVNGRRETLARYPNFDPTDIQRKGWLYVDDKSVTQILAGLAKRGDWVEYQVEIPKDGRYSLWLSVATVFDEPHRYLALKVDGQPAPLQPMVKSGGWRSVRFSRAATLDLKAGKHTVRWESSGPENMPDGQEYRVHLGPFLFSDNPGFAIEEGKVHPEIAPGETRVCVDAADTKARTGGFSSITFQRFVVSDAPKQEIRCPVGTIREAWRTAPHAEVFTFATWGWFNVTAWVDSFAPRKPLIGADARRHEMDVLHLKGREARSAIWQGNRFYVFNLLAELDQPGEWYLDYPTGRLSYWPRTGSMQGLEVIAPRLDRLVTLRAPVEGEARVEHVALRGFTFVHTDYTADHPDWRSSEDCAVLMENTWHCAVEDCTFSDIGGYAVRLSLDSCLNRVTGNTVSGGGAGGFILRGPWVGWNEGDVLAGGPAAAVTSPLGNVLTDNHVHHCGEFKKYVAGIHAESRPGILAHAPSNVFSHNLIHDMPRNGIFAFRNQGGYVMENNHIHHVLNESDDGGLIHVCTAAINNTAPAIVRNNLLHDAYAFRFDDDRDGLTGLEARANGHGIYLDGETSHVLVTRNVVRNTRRGTIFLHSGENNTVENNILLSDRRSQYWQTETWTGNRFRRNLVVWDTPAPVALAPLSMRRAPTADEAALFDENLYWHGGQPIEMETFGTFTDWQAKGFDKRSLVADPLFERVDLPGRVCALRPASPAFRLGFQAIDLSRVGPRPGRSR